MANDDPHRARHRSHDELQVLSVSNTRAFATWRNTLVMISRLQMTIDEVTALDRHLRELAGHHPEGTGLLTVIEPTSPTPSLSLRAEMAGVFRRAQTLKVSAIVYEGTGFRESIVRSVVTSMSVLARLPFEYKVFASVLDACDWFLPRLPDMPTGTDPDLLPDCIDDLRRAFPR